eukprot:Tbor_TRINITY_DN5806_c0_g1::TRINITY_DN5806_c0_g1_i11::g.7367::m.7367/K11810/SLC16A12; MFS transporter, MCP family, solute carrier family 16 (monocarboxylic acid transporters), member 12
MFGKLFEIAPAPPDGWKAFVVACCGCLLQTMNFGISGCFGSFSNALHEDEGLGYPSKTQISIAASVSNGLGPILGLFSGILVAKFGSRFTCLLASIGLALSMILPALLANSVVTLIFTYSVFIAFGGFMAAAGATANSTWFVKRKSLGMGINFSGGGWGSLTIPYIAGVLQSKYDWRTCFLILSSLTSVSLICSMFVCLRPGEEKEDENEEGNEIEEIQTNNNIMPVSSGENEIEEIPVTDWRSARHERKFTNSELFYHVLLTKDFIVLFLLFALLSIGLYAVVFCAVPYTLSMGRAGTVYADAPVLSIDRAVSIFISLGAAQIISGPVLGYLAAVHFGDKIICGMCCAFFSVFLLVWIACRELWQHHVMMALMGMCLSGFFATYPSMIGHKFYGPNLPIVMGIQFVAGAVGGFSGGPLATALAVANNGDYTVSLIVISVVIFLATIIVTFGIDCNKLPCGSK